MNRGLEEMGGVESGRTRPESGGGLAVSAAVRAPAGAMWNVPGGAPHPWAVSLCAGRSRHRQRAAPGQGLTTGISGYSIRTDQSHQPNHHIKEQRHHVVLYPTSIQ